jgi:hypothetical protein
MSKFLIASGVKKATSADARYLPSDPIFAIGWTPAMDRRLAQLCQEYHMTEAARQMGINIERVQRRVLRLGIPCMTLKETTTPTEGEWLGAAAKASLAAGINVRHVLSGSRQRSHVQARWAAWRALLDGNPQFSMKGVGEASGFDHSSVLHGMRRLRELSLKVAAE